MNKNIKSVLKKGAVLCVEDHNLAIFPQWYISQNGSDVWFARISGVKHNTDAICDIIKESTFTICDGKENIIHKTINENWLVIPS